MKISITSGVFALALTAMATSCSTVARRSAPKDKVYLVGVAGGG